MLSQLKRAVKRKILAQLLKGNNVKCTVCGSTYSSFFPYLNRANAQCPGCGSLERTRLIYHFITNLKLINSHTQILHFAPEQCLYDVFTAQSGSNYIPADKMEQGYTYPANTQHIDITVIPMADASVDMVIAIHVLEHVQDDAKALNEIYRVLHKGGVAILQVPYEADRAVTYEDDTITTPEARKEYFGQTDHVRIYGRDYIDRFTKAGFAIEHADYAQKIPEQIRERYVFKKEEIFLLRK